MDNHVQYDHPGQPEKIDNARVSLLIGAFQNGLDIKSACVYAGISRETYYKKRREDKAFSDTMERAQNSLAELAGGRITKILKEGADRDAGPIAWKIFEKKMPTLYGNQPAALQQNNQNNFFLINNEQLDNITKQSGLDETNPVKFFEEVEAASDMDDAREEGSTA